MSDTFPPGPPGPAGNNGKRETGRHTSRGRQNLTGGSTAGSPAQGGRANPYEPLPPELDPRGRRAAHARIRETAKLASSTAPRSQTGRSVARWSILGAKIIAALLSLTVVVSSYWVWNTWTNFTSNIQHGDALPALAPSLVAGSSGATATAAPRDIDGPDQNILLLGNDSRAGATPLELGALGTADDGGSANTDTMMILHVPGNGKSASIMSFPRDSYVQIPGHGMAKLNAAYPDGYYGAKSSGASELKSESAGVLLVAQTLSDLTGLKIDHYVQINLLGFFRISNSIGGVPVLLCQAQKEPNSGINLPAGYSVIKGKQALAFVRQRYGLPNGDLDRVKRQQYFLRQAFHKLLTAGTLLNPLEIQSLLSGVSKSLLTDPSIDILQLASTFSDMSDGAIVTQTIPTDGFDNNTPAGDVVVVSPAEVQRFAAAFVGKGIDPKLATATTVAPSTVHVVVLNATSTDGIAGRNQQALIAAGFQATVGTNTQGTAVATEIEYPDGMQGQAKTLAAKIPGAQLVETSAVSNVTLRLGTDGQQVKGLGGTTVTNKTSAPTQPAIAAGARDVANQRGCIN